MLLDVINNNIILETPSQWSFKHFIYKSKPWQRNPFTKTRTNQSLLKPTIIRKLKRKLNCCLFSRKILLVTDRWLCADCDKRMWLRWKFHNSHTQKSKRLTFSKFGKGCVCFSRFSCLCGWVLHIEIARQARCVHNDMQRNFFSWKSSRARFWKLSRLTMQPRRGRICRWRWLDWASAALA